jgi:hypothetical protein
VADIHSPSDVRNPLAPNVTDFDWLEFVAFVWKATQEGSYGYAVENYAPRFEAAAMQVIAADPKQFRMFYDAKKTDVDTWWDTVGGQTACDLHNAHVDEADKRLEDARLWGLRCTDGYTITCDTREDRDQLAGRMQAEGNRLGRRMPAALLQRFAAGGDWNETRLPAHA